MKVIFPCGKYWRRQTNMDFGPVRLTAIQDFVTMIKSFASMLEKKNAYEVAFHVGKQTNLVKELFNDKSTEGVATI